MKHFYTDGIKTIKLDLEAGDSLPEGFHAGRTYNARAWNKGLTKADPRVLKNTTNCHCTRKIRANYHSWNTGLTKEVNKSLKVVAEKVSKARKGKSSWNKGLPATEERKRKQSQVMQLKDYTSEDWKVKSMTAQIKSADTKRRNNSFNTSKLEEQRYRELCQQYGEENVKRQYKEDSRYPFQCDFYIVSEDLFIELNGTWTHGFHPFNPDEKTDIEKLATWTAKAQTSTYYKNALKVWTQSDVQKLNMLREHDLNFMIEYPNNLIITK